MHSLAARLERHQAPLCLVALVIGAGAGSLFPQANHLFAAAITPALMLVLYATFSGIPFHSVRQALRDWRFLITLFMVNFVAVPAVAYLVTRQVADEQALLIGTLLVLLAPCVDYVIVFTGLAGGAAERLLAATPLLMLGQMILLPCYLWLFAGSEATSIDLTPFVSAFVLFIAIPLIAAALTQSAAPGSRAAERVRSTTQNAMVPLMMLTLALVVASQIQAIGDHATALLRVVPVYLLFIVIMVVVGATASRVARLTAPSGTAVVFSGVTRNSLVVLPLALALPSHLSLAPLAIVTQTLVELVMLVLLVGISTRLRRQPLPR